MGLKKGVVAVCGAAFFVILSFNAFAQTGSDVTDSTVVLQNNGKVVTVQGTAMINNGDRSSARKAAINDAMRKAVEQAVGVIVSSQTTVENYKLLNDKIYSNTSGYIHNYKILSEGKDKNLYTVTIQATVGTKRLKDDLGAIGLLMKRKKMPRVAVIILEQNIGEKRFESALFYAPALPYGGYVVARVHLMHEVGNMSVAENEMMKKLLDNGFNVVDAATLAKNIKLVPGYKLQTLNDNTVKKIGKLANVDIIIYGKAVAKLYGRVAGSEMRSAQANVSLKAVNTDDGRVLASGVQHAASVHIDAMTAGNDAIKKATNELADTMIAAILDKWKQETNNGSLVKLTIDGIKAAGELVELKDTLMSTDGVQDVYERSIGNGRATMDVNYTGNAQALIKSLLANKTVTALYSITGATMNTITLKKK